MIYSQVNGQVTVQGGQHNPQTTIVKNPYRHIYLNSTASLDIIARKIESCG